MDQRWNGPSSSTNSLPTNSAQPSSATHGQSAGGRFKAIRSIGKGAHGFVQLALDRAQNEKPVAIKYVPRGEDASLYKYMLREVLHHQTLSLCKHPHIVEFYEVFLTPRYLGIVMEYIDGADLQAYLMRQGGSLDEDVARFVFQQLVVAVDFIHRKGKVNRDIKLSNVLVVDHMTLPLVKICDFGFSKDRIDDSAPQTQIGTALFTAPEVFLNVNGGVYEGEAVDVWSCGIVLFMLLFGSHPFLSPQDMALDKAQQMVVLIENSVKGKLQMPPQAAATQASDLIARILVPNPKQRYTIKDIFAHPWFLTKLPHGALDLNSSYMPTSAQQQAGARQTPDMIRSIIKAAVNAVGPDGRLIPNRSYQQMQQQGGVGGDQMETSLDDLWMGAGGGAGGGTGGEGRRRSGGGQVAESQPAPAHPHPHQGQIPYNQLMTYTNYVVTSGAPSAPAFNNPRGHQPLPPRPPLANVAPQWQQWQTSPPQPVQQGQGHYPGSSQQQVQHQPSQQAQQAQRTMEEVYLSMQADADLAQMILGGGPIADDHDPHPEPLAPEGMDVSGGVLFDSNLLEMLLKDCQSLQNLNHP